MKVEPLPTSELSLIWPPCISIIRFEIARPRPVPPFCLVMVLSACWNSLNSFSYLTGRCPVGIRHGDRKQAISGARCDRDLTSICELDRVPDQVQQDLRQPTTITVTNWNVVADLRHESKRFARRKWLHSGYYGVHHVLQRILSEIEGQLSRLDLRQVEHIVDQIQ